MANDAIAQPHMSVIPREQHNISRKDISENALKVLYRLNKAGYEAYLVGGGVRDLLLGKKPKDFDVTTSATPEQVRKLFRNCRLVGRRFRLAHVMFGPEIIEVATFRGHHEAGASDRTTSQRGQNGMLLRDNIFGSIEEDAQRRDFTINSLYYSVADFTVRDYVGGMQDLKDGLIRLIGTPETRYREDPVRMLRAVRMAAKLDLSIDPEARQPIRELASLIENVPPSRLFDEMLKLLSCGHAVKCIARLRDEGLHHGLLPLLDVILAQPSGERFVMLALANTDQRVQSGKPVSPGFLFATLLWNEVLTHWEALKQRGERPSPALFLAMDEVLEAQAEKLAITRRVAGDIKDIWALQPRFEQRTGKRPYALLAHPRFRAGYDFLLLRAAAGEVEDALAQWWAEFIDADSERRAAMLLPPPAGEKKRRRRKAKTAAAA